MIKIFEQNPDLRTLHALVRPSPVYHQVYVAARERILTRVTLDGLARKGVELPQLQDDAIIEYSVRRGLPSQDIIGALGVYYAPSRKEKVFKLKVRECIALLSLTDVVSWWIEKNVSSIATEIYQLRCSRPATLQLSSPTFLSFIASYPPPLSPAQILIKQYGRFIIAARPEQLAIAYPDGYANYNMVHLRTTNVAHTWEGYLNEANIDRLKVSILQANHKVRDNLVGMLMTRHQRVGLIQ